MKSSAPKAVGSLAPRLRELNRAALYAIVDLGYVERTRVPSITAELVDGGARIIQLRAKGLPLDEIAALGREMRRVIPPAGSDGGALFILNDHPELVPEVGADGLHVGQDDLPVAEARKIAGRDVIVGKSTHGLDQAIAAEREGADYIGVGPIYATPTKPDYVPVGPGLIGQVAAAVKVPQFCIGGIKEDNLRDLFYHHGLRRAVIVSGLLQAVNPAAACRRVLNILQTSDWMLNR